MRHPLVIPALLAAWASLAGCAARPEEKPRGDAHAATARPASAPASPAPAASAPVASAPTPASAPANEPPDVSIQIDAGGFAVSYAGKRDALPKAKGGYDHDALRLRLKELKAAHPAVDAIIIDSDPSLEYRVVVDVLDDCKSAGFVKISMHT